MNPNHNLALIISYYLSRFNEEAYRNLGYATISAAHQDIGERLAVNPNSVKNMRDEFDPLHENGRVGWYQRPLRPSRRKVVEAYQELTELELRTLVREILENPAFQVTSEGQELIASIENAERQPTSKYRPYIVRGPTGRKAEEYFIQYHANMGLPNPGELVDTRDLGTGYDFEIRQQERTYYIEVKGLYTISGGIVFTGKEWEKAQKYQGLYYLALIRNLSESPEIYFVQDPAAQLTPQFSIIRTVQIHWSIREKDLMKLIE